MSAIVAIWLRFLSVAIVSFSASGFVHLCINQFKVHLGGRPLPSLTQVVIDCHFVFYLVAIFWLVWAVFLTMKRRTPAQQDLYAAASLLVIAVTISLLALAMPLPFYFHVASLR